MNTRKETYDISENLAKKHNGSNHDKIKAEFEKYIKNPTNATLAELAHKYKDDEEFMDEFLKYRNKRYQKIKRDAIIFADKILKKYANGNKPMHEILNKMMKYAKANKLSDYEYDEYRKEITNRLTGNRAYEIDYNQNLTMYRSRINKALGAQRIEDSGLNIKDTEQGILSDILRLYKETLPLHNSVFVASLMYEDCSLVALTGEFKRDKHTANNYIHPILAAMYLPKFELFEIYTLYANIGRIIKTRYEKKQIVTEPDALLYYEMISDPNDVVCEITSAIADLKNRYQVQINLWETVLKLRNGNYYDAGPINSFITALNSCRNNLYDNADLAYNQDDGAILRKLLSVFSIRPTILVTKPLYGLANAANYSSLAMPISQAVQNILPFNSQPVYTITSVPMIIMHLPPVYDENTEPKNLQDAIRQTIWINENKVIVPKEQSIIFSKEVLIFYVNRRVQRIQVKTFLNPISFSQLPLTMSSLERINKYPLYVPDMITIRNSTDEAYSLRSVVTVTETSIQTNGKVTSIITGSNALITIPRNIEAGVYDNSYLLYDPLGASIPVQHPLAGQEVANDCRNNYNGYITNKPISYIPRIFTPVTPDGLKVESFYERASTCGTIFIYAKSTGFTNNNVVYM